MDSRTASYSRFAIAVTARALLLGAFAFAIAYLLVSTQRYATAVVLALIALALGFDLGRVVSRADRSLERFLEGLTGDVVELPIQRYLEFSRSAAAFERAARVINATRMDRQRRIEYMQALLDTVSAALIVLRSDGRVTLVNRAARKLTGTPALSLEDLTAIGPSATAVLRALRPGGRQIVRLADGRRMLALAAVFSAPGEDRQGLISLQPIAGELDAVETRAWQEMATILAHEMMNSLTPISSLSESLEALVHRAVQRDLDAGTYDEISQSLEAIRRRSDGLMKFVDRYRKVAELPQPNVQPIHAVKFITGISNLMSVDLSCKRVAFSCSVVPEDLLFVADPELLEQAVINLLRNAIDAAAEATSPSVEVLCWVRDRQIMIAVRDNGAGVREEQREQMFVPFFTTKPGGSGIGLSLARQVAIAHGGRLEVHANQPHGLVFLLTWPLVQPSEVESLRTGARTDTEA
jgi:two-component system nitrogen regulation sensor histidine kinase NtrY